MYIDRERYKEIYICTTAPISLPFNQAQTIEMAQKPTSIGGCGGGGGGKARENHMAQISVETETLL